MSTGAVSETVSRQFCWEQILRTNPLFRVSHVFAEPGSAQRLLPLYALFSAIEQASGGISEQEVAYRKLEWWREECLLRDMAESDHPILQEACSTGAAGRLSSDALARLIMGAQSRLDAPAPAEIDDLRQLCQTIGEPQLELEAGVCGLSIDSSTPDLGGIAALNGLTQLIREGGTWWLPMQLLARHGISRSRIQQDADSDAVRDLFGEVLSAAREWNASLTHASDTQPETMRGLQHAMVISRLYARKINRLTRVQPSLYRTEISKVGIPDLFAAWQTARHVNRR